MQYIDYVDINSCSAFEGLVSIYEVIFDCGGRKRLPAVFIRRRNFEFLATIALNLCSWPNPLRGLAEIWSQIRQVRYARAFPVQLN